MKNHSGICDFVLDYNAFALLRGSQIAAYETNAQSGLCVGYFAFAASQYRKTTASAPSNPLSRWLGKDFQVVDRDVFP